MNINKKIFISTGEVSGDIQGSYIVSALKKTNSPKQAAESIGISMRSLRYKVEKYKINME